MAAGDRDLGLQWLTIYYEAAGLQFQGITFDQMTAAYDQASPSFIETFGGSVRTAEAGDGGITDAQVTSALQNLANDNAGRIPDYHDFIPALIQEFGNIQAGVIGHIVLGTLAGAVAGPIGAAIGGQIGEGDNLNQTYQDVVNGAAAGRQDFIASVGVGGVVALAGFAAYILGRLK